MKRFLFAVCLLSLPALAQNGGVLAGTPTITNTRGEPVPFATVAICISNPGTAPATPCGSVGNLATISTDITLGTHCTNNVNPPNAISGVGCTNPGTSDGNANVVAFASPGVYYCEYYGGSIVVPAVFPCFFASGGSGAVSSGLVPIPNCPVGTVQNETVQLSTQSGNLCATIGAISSTSVIGICNSSCGNSGIAQVAIQNFQNAIMDNSATANHYVAPSSSVAGFLTDTGVTFGATPPPSTVETCGIVGTPNTGGAGNAANVMLSCLSLFGTGPGGTGVVSSCAQTGPFAYYSGLNILSCDLQIFRSAPGIGTAQGWNFNGPGAGFLNLFQGSTPTSPPAGADQIAAITTITTPYTLYPHTATPPTSGNCVKFGSFGGGIQLQDAGNPCGTSSGNFLPFTTVPQPTSPTLTVNGSTGTTHISYAVVACQDTACTQNTPASAVATTTTANATLTSGNSVTLSGYQMGSNGTSVRCWNIYRTATNGTSPTTTGLIASCVDTQFTDTGLPGDSTTAPSANNTVLLASPQPFPGCALAVGGLAGIDAPNCTTDAHDDDFTWTGGGTFTIADTNDPKWTWLNQNGATATLTNGILVLQAPTHGAADNINCVTQPVPGSTPYAYAVWMDFTPSPSNASIAFGGLGWTDGTKYLVAQGEIDGNSTSNGGRVVVNQYTNSTTNSATVSGTNIQTFPTNGLYLAIKNDGTNLKTYTSSEGVFYVLQNSQAIASFITPTKLAVCIDSLTGTNQFGFDYIHAITPSRLP